MFSFGRQEHVEIVSEQRPERDERDEMSDVSSQSNVVMNKHAMFGAPQTNTGPGWNNNTPALPSNNNDECDIAVAAIHSERTQSLVGPLHTDPPQNRSSVHIQ